MRLALVILQQRTVVQLGANLKASQGRRKRGMYSTPLWVRKVTK